MNDEELHVALAYLAGALTVAVVLPVCFVAAVRYVPPVRRAFRHGVAGMVDTQVRNLSAANGDPMLRLLIGSASAILPGVTGEGFDTFVHNHVSNLAADAALRALGAPTGE